MLYGIGPSWLEKQKLEKNTWGFFGPRFENFWAGKMGEKFPGAILFHGLKNLSTKDVLKWRVDQRHLMWRFRHLLSAALEVTYDHNWNASADKKPHQEKRKWSCR